MTSRILAVLRVARVLSLLGLVTMAGCAPDSRAPTASGDPVAAASRDADAIGDGNEAGDDDTDAVTYSLVVVAAPSTAAANVVLSPQPVIQFVLRDGSIGDTDQRVTASLIGGPGRLRGHTTVRARDGVARFTDLEISEPGSYTIVFSAPGAVKAGTRIDVVRVNDFSLSVSPTSVSMTAGSLRTVTISTAVTAGVAQNIALEVSGLPAGVTGLFNVSSVTAGQSTTLRFFSATKAPVGSGIVTVTGTAPGGAHTASVAVSITPTLPDDFSVAVSPTAVALIPGTTRTVTVSTAVTGGAAQTIALALSGLPPGVTGTVSPTVFAGGSVTMSLTAAANAPIATTNATLTGTAISGTHTASLGVSVITPVPNDFAIAVSPTAVALTPGSTRTVTVATAVTGGLPQTISLAIGGLPAGVTGTVIPTVSAGGSTTLTLTAAANAAIASTTATMSGVAPSGTHTASLGVSVIAPSPNDFSIAAFPSSVTLAPGASKVVVVSTAVTSGVAQSISLAASGLPLGVTASFSPTSVSAGGSATLTLTASAAAGGGSAVVTVTGTAASGAHSTTFALILTPRAVNDFAMEVLPASLTLNQGTTRTVNLVTVVSSGVSQLVSLSLSGLPAGVTGSVSPNPTFAGVLATITLSASSGAALGGASITVTGTAVSGTHTATLALTVAPPIPNDFSISAFPAGITLARGTSLIVTVSTAITSGVAQNISLAISGLPAGLTASFTPASVSAGGSATLTLTASATAPAGSANVTIQGAAISGSHSTSVSVTVAP